MWDAPKYDCVQQVKQSFLCAQVPPFECVTNPRKTDSCGDAADLSDSSVIDYDDIRHISVEHGIVRA